LDDTLVIYVLDVLESWKEVLFSSMKCVDWEILIWLEEVLLAKIGSLEIVVWFFDRTCLEERL